MSAGSPVPLARARRIADNLAALLDPACARLTVAGSIRRERPEVWDIEIVAMPFYREEPDPRAQPQLFAPPPPPLRINRLWERVEEISEGHQAILPIKPGVAWIEADPRWHQKRLAGSRYLKFLLPREGIKVDLFLADATTWGLVLAIRTGSAMFSQALVSRWTAVSRGGHAKAGLLTNAAGLVVPTPEEEDVFRACRVAFIQPSARKDSSSLKPHG